MVIHSACLLWGTSFCPLCPHTSFAICYGVEHWGQGVLHQGYWASGTREGGWPFGMMGMWSWCVMKVVCGSSIINALWTSSPLVSPASSLHHHPHHLPQLASLRKYLWTPLLMEAAFAVAPQHDRLRLHWVMVNLGAESRKVIIKVARRARIGTCRANIPPDLCLKVGSTGVGGGNGLVGSGLVGGWIRELAPLRKLSFPI